MNDPKQVAFLREQAMFSGLGAAEVEARVQASIQSAADNYAYMNTSDITKMDPNKFALEATRAANDRANIKYKHELETPVSQGVQYQYEPATNQLNKPLFNIDDVNWRDMSPSSKDVLGVTGALLTNPLAAPLALFLTNPAFTQKKSYTGSLDQFINSPEAKSKGVDPVLAEDVLNTLKRERQITGNNYSKSFEQDF